MKSHFHVFLALAGTAPAAGATAAVQPPPQPPQPPQTPQAQAQSQGQGLSTVLFESPKEAPLGPVN